MSIQFQRRFLLEDEDSTVEEVGTGTPAAGPTLEPVRVKKQMEEEELKLGIKYDYKGDSGYISTGGSQDPKNWKFLGDKQNHPYLDVKADLIPSEKQPGKYDGAFGLGMGKGHHIDEDAPILAGGKIKDNYAVSHFGYKKVPKGHAELKGIIVKDLWETLKEGSGPFYVVYNKGRGQGKGVSNEYQPFTTEEEAQAYADKQNSWEVGMPGGGKYYYVVGPDHDDFKRVLQAAPNKRQLDSEMEESINENYHRFKKETVTRTKAQQMHEAAKAIERKLHEVNKILEYTSKLKSELFEENGDSEVSHHTKKVMERVTRSIAEAYSKLKNIK